MKDQLINFETAKLAKEKGFNEWCMNFYRDNGTLVGSYGISSGVMMPCKQHGFNRQLAPTQSLIQKWLRENHKISCLVYCRIRYEQERNKDDIIYSFHLFNQIYGVNYESTWEIEFYDTYEEALEKGLQEGLKLIEK